jgi:hypothetical protein
MRSVCRWAIVLAIAAIIVGIGTYSAHLIKYGLSVRDQPSSVETAVVRRLRGWAIPTRAKSLKNPITANPEMLVRGGLATGSSFTLRQWEACSMRRKSRSAARQRPNIGTERVVGKALLREPDALIRRELDFEFPAIHLARKPTGTRGCPFYFARHKTRFRYHRHLPSPGRWRLFFWRHTPTCVGAVGNPTSGFCRANSSPTSRGS